MVAISKCGIYLFWWFTCLSVCVCVCVCVLFGLKLFGHEGFFYFVLWPWWRFLFGLEEELFGFFLNVLHHCLFFCIHCFYCFLQRVFLFEISSWRRARNRCICQRRPFVAWGRKKSVVVSLRREQRSPWKWRFFVASKYDRVLSFVYVNNTLIFFPQIMCRQFKKNFFYEISYNGVVSPF